MTNDWSKTDKDFIPEKVTLGRFKDYAFLTCKFNDEKWVSPSVFERLCGYKPHTQRDSKKELKKAIFNVVDVIDNEPTKGFRFVSYGGNVYGISDFNDNNNVILRDPRGFDFPVTLNEFFGLLEANGGNLKDNVLDNIECVYAWSSGKTWRYLLPTSSPRYAKVLENSKRWHGKMKDGAYLTKKDLVVGHVYNGDPDKMPGKFMYMGTHDIYSKDFQMYAFSKQSYDAFPFAAKDSQDITGESKMVFYKLGATGKGENGCLYSYRADEPYNMKSSFSKLIVDEDPNEDGSSFEMYNSTLKCTYANIKADMEESLLFNKMVFPDLKKDFKPISRDHFAKMLDYITALAKDYHKTNTDPNVKNEFWPYPFLPGTGYRNFVVKSSKMNMYVEVIINMTYPDFSSNSTLVPTVIVMSKDVSDRFNGASRLSYMRRNTMKMLEKTGMTSDELYDELAPEVRVIHLMNGKALKDGVAASFTHPNIVDTGYNSYKWNSNEH